MSCKRLGLPMLGACLLLLAAGCDRADSADPSTGIERGREILAPFKKQLQGALRAGLAQGPVEAISACRVEAPRIAAASSHDGVEVGRTSHRLRNPANAPRPWVAPLLEAFVAGEEGAEPRAVALPDGRVGYVEPIRLQGVCLTCHGARLAPPVAARIEALYPEDQAVGFAEGDLRGLFWAEFPAP